MRRNRSGHAECLVILVLVGMILGITLGVLGEAKAYAISHGIHPALSLLAVIVFWGAWIGVISLVSLFLALLRPKCLYPDVHLRENSCLVDDKNNFWYIKSITDVFGLECRVYPAAPGYISHWGQCNKDLSDFSTEWKEAGQNLRPCEHWRVWDLMGSLLLVSVFLVGVLSAIVGLVLHIISFCQWMVS